MREVKKTIYICAGIKNNELCFLETEALSKQDAISNYILKYNEEPKEVSGPFLFRRENSKRKLTNIKFSNKSFSGIYNGWRVIANELTFPNSYVFLLYDSRVDGLKLKKPENEMVHISKVNRI